MEAVNFETDQSEQDRVAASTGKGPSGAISLQSSFSDHSAGGVSLHVGETFRYRNGGELHSICSLQHGISPN